MSSRILASLAIVCSVILIEDSYAGSKSDTTGSTGFLYGTDHVFSLTAPDGWVLDNISGISQGLYAVFYPEGESWKNSPAVMYGKGQSKDTNQTLQDFITDDSTQFTEKDSSVKILDCGQLKIGQGKTAVLRKFLYSQYEVVAYIDEPKIVAMIVLTSRSKEAYDSVYYSFEELVRSYHFISDNHINRVTDWAIASKSADDNTETKEGKEYEENLDKNVGQWLSETLYGCMSASKDTNLTSITVLLRIGSSGRAEEVLTEPNTKTMDCIAEAFNAMIYLKPPRSSWWVNFHIVLKDQ